MPSIISHARRLSLLSPSFTRPSRAEVARLKPLVLMLGLAGLCGAGHAADHTWVGGTGNWSLSSNWSPAGTPGAGERAIILTGNAVLSVNEQIGQLSIAGGSLSGAGSLTVTGASSLGGGYQFGEGLTRFNGALSIVGNHALAGSGRMVHTAGTTTWSGGDLGFSGNNTLRNTGTWNDVRNADAHIANGNPGTKLFDNAGDYVKSGSGTSSVFAAFNNTGSGDVRAGQLNLVGNVNSLSTGSFHVAEGATLSFGNGSSSGLATLDGASFSGTGKLLFDASNNPGSDVRLVGAYGHAGLTQVSAGHVQIDGAFNASSYVQDGGSVLGSGTLTVAGPATLSGGYQYGEGSTRYNGALSIVGDHALIGGGRVVHTAGTTTWSGGDIAFSGNNTLRNTGAWNDVRNADAQIANGNPGTKLFDNAGDYVKSGGGTTSIFAAFNNTGSVEVQAGRLNLVGNANSLSTGRFHVADGATLSFGHGSSAGLATLDGASFSGSGRLLFDASNNPGSDVRLVGSYGHAGLTQVSAGHVQIDGAFNASSYVQDGGSVLGSGTLSVNGNATLSGGYQYGEGSTRYNGALSIVGDHALIGGGRVVHTAGTTTWSGGDVAFSGNNTLRNTGTWNDMRNADAHVANGNPGTKLFDNVGDYVKSGSGTTSVFAAFNNTGSVDVRAGQLNLVGNVNSLSTGSFHVAEGATLSFGNGSSSGLATLDGASFSGTGKLLFDASNNPGSDVRLVGSYGHAGLTQVSAGHVQIDGAFNASTYLQDGGSVLGSGTLSVNGNATLSGGYQYGEGSTRYNGALSIVGDHALIGGGRVVHTAGTTTWSGGDVAFSGNNTLRNTGTWNDVRNADAHIANGNPGTKLFDNAGDYVKSGSGATTVHATLTNTGGIQVKQGTLAVTGVIDNRGTIDVDAGTTFFGNHRNFVNHGMLRGEGTVRTAVNDDLLSQGLIAPGSGANGIGTLTIDGDLTLAAGNDLQIGLGSSSSADLLAITDDVTLGGRLSVLASGYAPVAGDRFIVMTFDQRLAGSVFDTVDWAGLGGGVKLDVIYNLHDVTLAISAVPEPSSGFMALAGIGLVGLLSWRRRLTGCAQTGAA